MDWGIMPTETENLLQAWFADDDVDARARLIEEYLPLVRALARRFSNRAEQLDDLAQVGALGLIKAVDRYDPRYGGSLAAYAIPTILGEIHRYLRDSASLLKLPRGQRERATALSSQRDALETELGRPPTLAELAAAAALPVDSVVATLADVAGARLAVLDEESGRAEDAEAARRLERGVDRAMLARGLRRLDRRERRIVELRYYGGLSQRRIAAEVGLSQVHVSRLLERSLAKLRQEIGQA